MDTLGTTHILPILRMKFVASKYVSYFKVRIIYSGYMVISRARKEEKENIWPVYRLPWRGTLNYTVDLQCVTGSKWSI